MNFAFVFLYKIIQAFCFFSDLFDTFPGLFCLELVSGSN